MFQEEKIGWAYMFEKYRLFSWVTSAKSKISGIDNRNEALEMGKGQVKVTLYNRGRKWASLDHFFKGQIFGGELVLVDGWVSKMSSLENGKPIKELS